MRILHAKPENVCAKMSEFGSFCVHHVALNGEAVKSNVFSIMFVHGLIKSVAAVLLVDTVALISILIAGIAKISLVRNPAFKE